MNAAEEITALRARAGFEDVVRWSGAIDDYTPIHFDAAAAAERGLPGPVVNGPYKAALLARMLDEWLGGHGTVVKLACRYQRPDVVGAGLTCGGRVTAVTPGDAYDVVECELWVDGADGGRSVTGTATLHVAGADRIGAPAPDGTITLAGDALTAALRLGEEAGRFTYEVSAADLERFRAATGDPGTGPDAPPTYFAALDPVERRELRLEAILDEVPYAKTGGGNAFNEVEYERPIRAGDVITVVTTYSEVYERDGRSGRLLFRVRTNELLDAGGDRVARTRMGHVLAFDLTRRVR